ncbi:MAG: class I SAM-dependent methyltransferase [Bacteroidia bacterium]
MQERHVNRKKYFNEQIKTTARFVVPYIQKHKKIDASTKVLEIGCGEGGNLKPFLDLGCTCVGVDLSLNKIELGKQFFSEFEHPSKPQLIVQDIYETNPQNFGKFDVIIMRDVIEHIHHQEKFMGFVKQFLTDDGLFFLGFPPWQNPFGGHQQVCKNKVLSVFPYFHLLPKFIYKAILKLFSESESTIEALLEIKQTGISLERFERILKTENYKIIQKTFYLMNPNYQIKFGLKPREQFALVAVIPYLRNFFTTAAYYLIRK